jgi:hypothetical protein
LAQLIKAAAKAQSIMAAYCPAAFGTSPFCRFLFQELLDTVSFYEFKVIYHAHMVLGSVAFIEGFKPSAGEVSALITEPHQPPAQQTTSLFHEGTVLATWNAARAVSLTETLLLQVAFHRQVTGAHTAVHPARGYQ